MATTIAVFIGIFAVSLVLAWISMRDIVAKRTPRAPPARSHIRTKKGAVTKRGTILLFKGRVISYGGKKLRQPY